MSDARWAADIAAGIDSMGLSLNAGQQEKLLGFLRLLNKWNSAYNLTAVRDPAEMVSRQLLDSLSILPFLKNAPILDVGAGGGLPGVPLAIALPERSFTLLDSNSKKTRFLTQCRLELQLPNLTVVHARAEHFPAGETFEQITSRAFTALANLVDWCGHLLAPGGRFLAMKGQFPDAEIADLPTGWQLLETHRLTVPGCEAERHLLIIGRE